VAPDGCGDDRASRQRPRVSTPPRERARPGGGRPRGRVEILVVDDVEIRRLNAAWRGVGGAPTSSRSRSSSPTPRGLVGQIVISVDAARRQARKGGVPIATELDLLVTHGVLHAVGYDDRDPVEAASCMRVSASPLRRGRRPPERLWRGLLA